MTVASRAIGKLPGLVRRVAVDRSSVLGGKVLFNVLLLVIVWAVLTALTPRFLTPENLSNVSRQIAFVATVASAVTILMISRNFDLSVGGVIALSGCVAASVANDGMPVPLAFAAGTAVGIGVGATNGILVVLVGINSVIATLGTMYLARGSALLVTNGLPVYSVPPGYEFIGAGYIWGVPVPTLIMFAAVAAMSIVLGRMVLGKYARATGSNPDSARLAGIPIRLVQFALFVIVGAAAGWGGVMVSSRVGGGYPTVGVGFEFQVVVAAVLGGTSLNGGRGSVIGTFLGALVIGSLNNGLDLLSVSSFWQTVVLGLVLLLALGLDALLDRISRTRSTARASRNRADIAMAEGGHAGE